MSVAGEPAIADEGRYLERMGQALQEKLRVAHYLPASGALLDVGCADGRITCALGALRPAATVRGIDLDEGFIARARERAHAEAIRNTSFERAYLRDLLARPERYDAVLFASVLHEFYSYGQGMSSVLKALADAHELLRPGGRIVIRDMILREATKHDTRGCADMAARMRAELPAWMVDDFTGRFGPLESVYAVNHLALKYRYADNWAREGGEFYVPITVEQYERIFELLGMRTHVAEETALPFLRERWAADLGFSAEDIERMRSTTIIVAER